MKAQTKERIRPRLQQRTAAIWASATVLSSFLKRRRRM